MAETLISPGVLARENDTSQVTSQPVQAGAAIIGPTAKGPVGIPTLVTTYSQFQQKFGTTFTSGSNSDIYTYFTSIAAYNYFANGGTSLLVARVVSGSYESATSTDIVNLIPTTPGAFSTASKDLAALTNPINVEFRILDNSSNIYRFLPTASGNYQDDVDGKLFFFASSSVSLATTVSNLANKITSVTGLGITSLTSTTTLILSGSTSSSFQNGYRFQTGSGASFSTQATLAGGIDGGGSVAFVLETIAQGIEQNSSSSIDISGSLLSGSAGNIRYQILNWNTGSGTFSLLIRGGNDNTLNPNPLETYTGLSLDPFSPNFISKVIGDVSYSYKTDGASYYLQQTGSYVGDSAYVRVKSTITTPNYLDNNGDPKSEYTASIPINQSGSFKNASGTLGDASEYYDKILTADRAQGVPVTGTTGQDYISMINLLSNKDDYRFNILLAPGLFNSLQTSAVTSIISVAEDRGDFIFVNDLYTYGATLSQVTSQATGRNTSYAASYWPWVQTQDPDSGRNVWVPASTVIGGVYAYNDRVAEPWFAPAGINRGGLQVIRAERRLSQTDRDTLYQNKVNPIATFPGQGVVVYGQKTLQTKPSALDRVNVRRLLIALKSYISQVANNLVFEQNTTTTRNNFLAQVNPYLESVQQRQGLYAFRVIMDESNNTAVDIDRNQLNGGIYVQPTKTAEFIYLDFNITPTGATFPA